LSKGSLRNKIIAWSFVPTAIILVTVTLVSLYTYQRVTENLVIERDRDLTRLSADLLGAELAVYTDPLANQFLTVFDGVVLFTANGTVLAAEPEGYERWGADWLKNISFDQRFRSSEPVFSNVVVDGLEGEKILVVAMPLQGRQGGSVGGIAGLYRLDPTTDSALYRSIEKLRRGESNCVYLVDGNGRVIYHSSPDYIGDDFSKQTVVQRVLSGQMGALRARDLDGQDIVASFAPVPGTSWGLVTEESWSALIRPIRRYGQFLLLLLVLGMVAPAFIATAGVKRITQPIADLIGAAQEIARGNFGQRLRPSTGDELEKLAEQFNLMAVQLQESYTHMEQKVADRTKELATLNSIATVVSRSLDLEEILSSALEEAIGVTGMTGGQAFRLEERTQTLILMAHRGLREELVRHTARLPLDVGIAGRAAKEGEPVVRKVTDYPEGELRDLMEAEGMQMVISIPLMTKGRAVGAIDLASHLLRSVTPDELSLLAAIGQQIGVAIENAQLYEQAQQLAVMEERNRLARDLHDSVMQALYGVTLYAEAAARQLSSGGGNLAVNHLSAIRGTAQEALREMRLLIFELRPPILEREGLAAALQARLEAVEGWMGLETAFEAEGNGALSSAVEEGLYRVAQEALNNALKHAQASSVAVRLCQGRHTVTLEITDDGMGFDPVVAREQGGFGLRGMEERAAQLGGQLTVQSSPGSGTRIKVEVCR
jgi:signal transduction histidine kinase